MYMRYQILRQFELKVLAATYTYLKPPLLEFSFYINKYEYIQFFKKQCFDNLIIIVFIKRTPFFLSLLLYNYIYQVCFNWNILFFLGILRRFSPFHQQRFLKVIFIGFWSLVNGQIPSMSQILYNIRVRELGKWIHHLRWPQQQLKLPHRLSFFQVLNQFYLKSRG